MSIYKLPPNSLQTSGVTPATYGNSTLIPSLTIDASGRITSASNVSIVGGVSSVGGATGDVSNTQLLSSLLNVDGTGSSLDADLLDGQQGSYYTNATNISSGTLAAARLATSGVTAGTYGGAAVNQVAVVDAYGRVTSMSNVNIAISSSAVSGLAPSATTDTTNATNITSGTLSAARLATSGVAATTYGGSTNIPAIVIDTYGRITSAANVAVSIPEAGLNPFLLAGL